MGASQLVGGRAHVHDGVMKHEVLEMDEFALDPERGGGVGKMRPRDPSLADRART
jgi:hypothetical protein